MAERHSSEAGRRRPLGPPLWARLLVLLLVASLTVMYSYAGCQQFRQRQSARERIEAVEVIRAYVQRVERALASIDGSALDEDTDSAAPSRRPSEDR